MSLGFAHPLVLAGLLVLPLIWRLLRASPPPPRELPLASLSLMEGLATPEETPAVTPWWLAALRMAIAALAIIAFAEPRFYRDNEQIPDGPLLLIIDDGWPGATRWTDMTRSAMAAIAMARDEGRNIHILSTAPQITHLSVAEAMDASRAGKYIRSMRPSAWIPDRSDALQRLEASELKPAHIVWICDGLKAQSNDFATRLAAMAPLQVQLIPPRGAFAIKNASNSPDGPLITLQRRDTGVASSAMVTARSMDGRSLVLVEVDFAENASEAVAQFSLPVAVMNQAARFEIADQRSAGAIWLREDADARPHTGLVGAKNSGQPLLSAFHYIRRALEPYAELSEAGLEELLDMSPDALIMPDRRISQDNPNAAKLTEWLENGGVLIRFAGPVLAADGDAFTPVPLRPAARALGGAMAWEKPQKMAEPNASSPFAGIAAPDDAFVRLQVLAEPGPELAAHTWAQLEDGTPIVTADKRGKGMVVLFHITATPEWSDLPYKSSFVEMLRRAAMSGQAANKQYDETKSLTPYRVLNGFGELKQSGDTISINAAEFAQTMPSPKTPPGLYEAASGRRALNAGKAELTPWHNFPDGVEVTTGNNDEHGNIKATLLSIAIIALILDILASLILSGALGAWRGGRAAIIMLTALAALTGLTPQASAEQSPRIMEAALNLRMAYIHTGNTIHDSIVRDGLTELGKVLYNRTAVEMSLPHAVRPGIDPLELYPLIYYAPPPNSPPLNTKAIAALNRYLRHGGALFIDTRDAIPGQNNNARLAKLLKGLDAPPLSPVPSGHVLTRSFYLLDELTGRLPGGSLWIEADPTDSHRPRGDGITGLLIGGSDWAGAWGKDSFGRPLLPMENGEQDREYAYRFGVNLVMYVLTGNYKEDQVHLPELLKRLRGRTGGNKNRIDKIE